MCRPHPWIRDQRTSGCSTTTGSTPTNGASGVSRAFSFARTSGAPRITRWAASSEETGRPSGTSRTRSRSSTWKLCEARRSSCSSPTPAGPRRWAEHAAAVVTWDGGGGYCWPDFAVSFDAIFTTVRLLELLAQTGTSLGELRARIPAVAHRSAVEFCPWEVKGRVMRTMMETHMKDRVDLTDGVKVFVDGGWVLVVPDADRPEYHIIASTLDAARSDRLVTEYSLLVRSVVAEAAPQAEAVVET